MTCKHTPGDWVTWIDRDEDGFITQAGVDTADRAVNIAVCVENMDTSDPTNEEQLVADLNLIAAAPRLLEVCAFAAKNIQDGYPEDASAVLEKLLVALAKAEGR